MDIEDNADPLRLREALGLVQAQLSRLLLALAERIDAEADTITMAYTHLQPAEPTTIGYFEPVRAFADYCALLLPRAIRGKGLANGTRRPAHLLAGRETTSRQLSSVSLLGLGHAVAT